MQGISAMEFTTKAKDLSVAARRAGLDVPSFRSPPQIRGRSRTVRHFNDGTALVSVVIHGRDRQEVLADMVEGVVVINHLRGQIAIAARRTLWRALLQSGVEAA